MRLDELKFDCRYVVDRADARAPFGGYVTVYRWAALLHSGYDIYVNLDSDLTLEADESWVDVCALQAQCVLFELWARRNWRQRLWRRLCDWMS